LASENQENEIVSIPGLRGRPHKEISVKNLAHIIQARMEEILEHVYYEIRNSGFEKKLIAGIVVTGGGAQLKHITQLFEYVTGMDTRVGYPNEHLAASSEEVTSPMFATGVGLVMRGITSSQKNRPVEDKTNVVTGHSDVKKRGGWFDQIFSKGKQWFEEDPGN
jgi:cell division protein FtsA